MYGLIDTDIIVYRVGSVADQTYWDYQGNRYKSKKELNAILKENGVDDTAVTAGKDPMSWGKCKTMAITYLEDILDDFDDYQLYLSGKGNFRYKVATIQPYKANRKSSGKPFYYDEIRQFYSEVYQAKFSVGQEADDDLGEAQTDETCIISTDKDMDCIPGWHFNWVTDKLYQVSEEEANKSHFKQLLLGDSTDNILGLYGVGPKSTLLSDINKMSDSLEMFNHVKEQYEKRFGSYALQFMQENATLLWIRQRRTCPTFKYINELSV